MTIPYDVDIDKATDTTTTTSISFSSHFTLVVPEGKSEEDVKREFFSALETAMDVDTINDTVICDNTHVIDSATEPMVTEPMVFGGPSAY